MKQFSRNVIDTARCSYSTLESSLLLNKKMVAIKPHERYLEARSDHQTSLTLAGSKNV